MSDSKNSTSFLLRVWLEPESGESAGGAVRGYLRNLQTGEEQYIGGTEALTAVIRAHVRLEDDQVADERPEDRSEGSSSRTRGSAS